MVISMDKSRVWSNFIRGANNFGLNCKLLFDSFWLNNNININSNRVYPLGGLHPNTENIRV